VKKLIGLGVLLLVACQRNVQVGSPTPSTSTAVGGTGATTPAGAITGFMAAAKAEDLQAVGNFWGTSTGPAREQMSRSEFEMRAYYIVKCVRHDSFTTLGESNAAGGQRVVQVQLKKNALTKVTTFTLVPGPQGRWYVYSLELTALNEICQLA
jgi:hypothetical protein